MKWIVIDIIATVGLGLFAAGAWIIYPPAALIGVGAILMALAIVSAAR